MPPNELRKLEEIMNKLFKKYVTLYYSSDAVYSVFVKEIGEKLADGFIVATIVKNG